MNFESRLVTVCNTEVCSILRTRINFLNVEQQSPSPVDYYRGEVLY